MKILVVDDHSIFRDGLARLLDQLGDDIQVLQAGGVPPALAMVADSDDLDLVILDLAMPGSGGLAAIAQIGRVRLGVPVIILSSSEDAGDVRAAFRHGALGYVPKSANGQTLLAAIRLVLDGERYVPTLMLDDLGAEAEDEAEELDSGVRALTERQVEVLKRVASGATNKRIAIELDLSEKTVKAHVSAIFRTLQAVNRTQAAKAGRDAGLI